MHSVSILLLAVEMARDSTRVYVGDLGSGGSKPELEREFERYGSLKSVWVARNPPGKLYFQPCVGSESLIRNIDLRLNGHLWAGLFGLRVFDE